MTGDLAGGAARGTYWLHKALVNLGVDSRILVGGSSHFSDQRIVAVTRNIGQRFFNSLSHRLGELPRQFYRTNHQHQQFDTGFGGSRYWQNETFRRADIINLHHITGTVSVPSLHSIRKPLVWTMRSMWPFTGGCHYSFDCKKYQMSCSACPQLNSTSKYDLANATLRTKRRFYPPHLQLVGVSDWVTQCARSSTLLKSFPIQTIYNGIELDEFQPVERGDAIRSLGLKPEPHYLLAIAQNFENRYKGFEELKQALRSVKSSNCHLLLVGHIDQTRLAELNFPHTSLGTVKDPAVLRALYSAATAHLASNLMETFGKTLVEAMACGTPVVCFSSTGPKEIVEHRVTGFCAPPYDAAAFAAGIDWILALKPDAYQTIATNARQKAVQRFDSLVIARQYVALYESMLQRHV
ncbi:MAG: glycosyltransferase [Burkholderiaceae bacterium]